MSRPLSFFKPTRSTASSGPAHPEIHVIDRVTRRVQPAVAHGDRHLVRARLLPWSPPGSSASPGWRVRSVTSIRVPSGPRRRSWNSPAFTLGKISMPNWLPTSTITRPHAEEIPAHQDPSPGHERAQDAGITGRGTGRMRTAPPARSTRAADATARPT